MREFDIIIVGAGMIGASLALSLAKHTRLSIALIDHQPKLGDYTANQRVSALNLS